MPATAKKAEQSTDLTPFQAHVKARLQALGRNAFEAARVGELERNFVNDIIDGTKMSVRGANLGRLAKALDWTIADVLGFEDAARPAPLLENALAPDVRLPPPGQEQAAPPILQGNRDVEVRGVSVGGDEEGADFSFNGQVTDYAHRPPGLAHRKDVFVVHAVNESMSPAIEPGHPLFVDSHKPPRPGEDVIVELYPKIEGVPGPAFIKRLVRRSGSKVTVRQFNPDKEIEFDTDRIKKLWRVIPLGELFGV